VVRSKLGVEGFAFAASRIAYGARRNLHVELRRDGAGPQPKSKGDRRHSTLLSGHSKKMIVNRQREPQGATTE